MNYTLQSDKVNDYVNMQKSEKEQLFDDLAKRCKDSVYRICHSYLENKSDIPDLYQDIMVAVWQSLDRFREESSWNTYIYRIAVNTAIKFRLKDSRKREFASEIPEIPDSGPDLQKIQLESQLNTMHRCIQQLADADRLLISLVLEDLSYKEIAEILGSSVNVVGVRINRIKKRILKLMEEGENGQI